MQFNINKNNYLIKMNSIQVQKSRAELNNEPQQHSQGGKNSKVCQFLSNFAKLYSLASGKQKCVIAVGVILGIISGVSHPLFIFLWCSQLQLTMRNQSNLEEHMPQFLNYLIDFIILGGCSLILNAAIFTIWKYISSSIAGKMKVKYLQHFIHLPIKEIQKKNSYQEASNFKTHTLNIEKSIGDKVALLLNLIGIFISGLLASFIIRWTLTLYILVIAVFGAMILAWFIYIQISRKQINIQTNRQAQEKSLESTTMIKTVKMLNAEDKEAKDYTNRLQKGQKELYSFSWKLGISTGLFYFIQYLFFGIGNIMGAQCVKDTNFCPVSATGSRYEISQYLEVFFLIFFCTFNFLQLASNYNTIKLAIKSSKYIYSFIENNPIVQEPIQMKRPQFIGKISIKNLNFSYPLNPEKKILKNISLQLVQNGTNAIVGATGCGKSTIIQLLLKQYLQFQGKILIGNAGVNLRDISNAYWLDNIGIVTQQPVLFSGSIRQNVQVGKEKASDEEVIEALQKANIYKDIRQKNEGLDFEIGAGGSKLSGGQKQRVAIARALVKNPQLLILDEATSALDRKTEKQIQETLQKVSRNLTTICIAHRLKTIQNSSRVFVIKGGRNIEQGKFSQMNYFKVEQPRSGIHPIQNDQKPETNSDQSSLERNIPIEYIPRINREHSQKQQKSIYYHLFFSYTKHKYWYVVCLVLALIIGSSHALSGLILSYSIDHMNQLYIIGVSTNWCQYPFISSQCNRQLDLHFHQSQRFLYYLLGYATFLFFPYFIQATLLSKIQNQIAFSLRQHLYKKLLSLQVKYFDQPQNQSGGAASRFGKDSRDACQLLTSYIPILISNFCTVIVAVIICFSYDWKFGLLSMLVTPLIALSFYIAMIFIGGYEDKSLQLNDRADQIANQLIVSIKTVLVLNYQQRLLAKYKQMVNNQPDRLLVGAKIGLFYGSAYFILYFAVGLALYLSIWIFINNPKTQSITIIVFIIVSILSGFITGNNFYFIAHSSAGKEAGSRIVELINRQSQSEKQSKNNPINELVKYMQPAQIKGRIQFRNVSFRYKKDGKMVLNNVSFVIQAGQKVAFVGASGCGKSSLLQLLLRFYEFQGEILLDNKNIFDYGLREYREFFAMLNQEPSLFAGTIKQNIEYNKNIDPERMLEICEQAAAYDFPSSEIYAPVDNLNLSNPEKTEEIGSLDKRINDFLNRRVGAKGSNISGGQKQRVACARALAREARIFLMDEGTSALDSTTEKNVLKGISSQMNGKTMINVAHRIETIQYSDRIFVFADGELKESGRYEQLMKREQYFYSLVKGVVYQEGS